jgi:hypothetical protein
MSIDSSQHSPTNAPSAEAIRDWGLRTIDQAHELGPIPVAGTPEWCALPDTDPRKRAAILDAAAVWAEEMSRADPLGEMNAFLDQLAQVDAELDRLIERRTSLAISQAQRWDRGPSWAELQRRRNTHTDKPATDPKAVRRWVERGTSTPDSVPTASPKAKDATAA